MQVMRLTQNKKKLILQYGYAVGKDYFSVFFALNLSNYSMFQFVDSTKQQREGTYTHKELIKRIMTFDYGKLLLLKSLESRVVSNIVITGKKEREVRHIIYASSILR